MSDSNEPIRSVSKGQLLVSDKDIAVGTAVRLTDNEVFIYAGVMPALLVKTGGYNEQDS